MARSPEHHATVRRHLSRGARRASRALALLVGASLAVGIAGRLLTEGGSFADAVLDVGMIMAGVGTVSTPVTETGKLFTGLFAVYSAFILVIGVWVVVWPLAQHVIGSFGVDVGEDPAAKGKRRDQSG